jgi:hypothetical protein
MTSAGYRWQRWIGPAWIGLAAVLAVLLWLSPAERTLGQTVKLVYLHGALVRTATVLFAISLPLNLLTLITGRAGWWVWGRSTAWAVLIIWLLHTLFSMVTTYAAWGVLVAWFEPRTRFTFTLAAVGLVIFVAARLIDSQRFAALAFAVLAGLALALGPRLGAIQHPLDPIGTSPSAAIRAFYVAIQAVSLGIGGLLAVWLRHRPAAGLFDRGGINDEDRQYRRDAAH